MKWSGPKPAEHWKLTDYVYPGPRVGASFKQNKQGVYLLTPAPGGGFVDSNGHLVDLEGRELVFAYGSNADPWKLHQKLVTRCDDDVIALRATARGWRAVWCNARREDGSVVATLVPYDGAEQPGHALALTRRQRDLVDEWEGHPKYYAYTDLKGGLTLEDGAQAASHVYVGTQAKRPPLHEANKLWPLDEHPYAEVDALVR